MSGLKRWTQMQDTDNEVKSIVSIYLQWGVRGWGEREGWAEEWLAGEGIETTWLLWETQWLEQRTGRELDWSQSLNTGRRWGSGVTSIRRKRAQTTCCCKDTHQTHKQRERERDRERKEEVHCDARLESGLVECGVDVQWSRHLKGTVEMLMLLSTSNRLLYWGQVSWTWFWGGHLWPRAKPSAQAASQEPGSVVVCQVPVAVNREEGCPNLAPHLASPM